MFTLFIDEVAPADHAVYTGAMADPGTGVPSVGAADRPDFLEGTQGTSVYTSLPTLNPLDMQSDAIPATANVGGWPGMPQTVWYDSERIGAGYPLPSTNDSIESDATPNSDLMTLAQNWHFGIEDYHRFGQPELVAEGHRITERTLDVPVPWKAQPTFPAQIQKIRPWDRVMGAWPWTGTKDAVKEPIVSTPLYFPHPIRDGIPSPGGSAGAMIPNTPSLSPFPLTWRVVPQQWDDDYVNSGV